MEQDISVLILAFFFFILLIEEIVVLAPIRLASLMIATFYVWQQF